MKNPEKISSLDFPVGKSAIRFRQKPRDIKTLVGWLVGWLVGEKISQIPSSYCFLFFEKHLNEKLRKYPDALELRKKVEDMGGTSLLNVDATKLHKVLLGFEGKMGGEDENRVSETDVQ